MGVLGVARDLHYRIHASDSTQIERVLAISVIFFIFRFYRWYSMHSHFSSFPSRLTLHCVQPFWDESITKDYSPFVHG